MGSRIFTWALAVLAAAAIAAPAYAQDYTVTNTSGRYESEPSSGVTTLTLGDDATTTVSLPFDFSYFGNMYSSVSVCSNGFVQFGGGSQRTPSNFTFPQTGGSASDGICAPYWDDIDPSAGGSVKHWTSGTSPNRRWVLTWDGVPIWSRGGNMRIQLQLYETSGKIVMAYGSGGTWENYNGYTVGIDEPAGADRYVYPTGYSGAGNTAGPPADFEFVPDETRFTGRVQFTEILTTSSGIGASTRTGVAPAGLSVELHGATGVAASGTVDANGDFTVRGLALVSSSTGSLHLSSKSLAADVSSSSSTSSLAPSTTVQIASNVSFGTNRDFGTLTVDDTNDADRSGRAALQISRQMETLRVWAQSRTTDVIPRVLVFFSTTASAPTSYSPGSDTVPPVIRVGGPLSSGSHDAFDPAVVSRIYARHVLKSINAADSATFSQSLDTATSATNALSEGFGLYLFSITGGGTQAIDGASSTSASVFDLETPSLSRAPANDVGGWAAAALYDLIDGANESHDLIDGTTGTNADRPFQVFDAQTNLVTPTTFLDEWDSRGFGSAALVTNFIRHGLLPDDTAEPNDSLSAAVALGTAGLRRDGLALNRFNEDWFRIFVPGPTDAFFVDVTYNRTGSSATIALEVLSPGGALLATGTPQGDTGPVRAITGPTGPGDVIVRVAHVNGPAISDYGLQAFSRLQISAAAQGEWTVKRPINQALVVQGGIPPYALSVKAPTQLPRGMLLDAPNLRLIGAPLEIGSITFTIQTTDAGAPANTTSLSQTFQVNAELAFNAPALTGAAVGKATDIDLRRTGGTNPVTVVNIDGDLPEGLTIDADFHIRGSATTAGGGDLLIEATDVAGSTATVDTTVVACGPFDGGVVTLAQGEAAAGFYFDALAGSLANLGLKTAKKNPKREFDVLLLAPDGNVVEGGVVKIKRGKAILKKVPLPKTGRYFLMMSADDGGEPSDVQGSDKIALPKKGVGATDRLAFSDQVLIEFGAVAGATFALKGKTTEEMSMRVLYVLRPDGTVLPIDDLEQAQNGKKYTLAFDCAQSGTYAVYLTPQPGGLGELTYKYKVKQPKGATYTFED